MSSNSADPPQSKSKRNKWFITLGLFSIIFCFFFNVAGAGALIFLLRSNPPYALAPPYDHDQIPSMPIADSINEERQDTVKWFIFIRSKIFGKHSPNVRPQCLTGFMMTLSPASASSRLTLPGSWQSSSIRATSDMSLSVHYILSVDGPYSNYSFPQYLVRSFTEHNNKLAVLPGKVDFTEGYMIGVIKSTECSLVSAGCIDGDDMLDIYLDEIVRGSLLAFPPYYHPRTLDTAMLHGTKKTRKVF